MDRPGTRVCVVGAGAIGTFIGARLCKGPSLAQVAEKVRPLLGPNSIVLTAMNGVPWWFFEHAVGACGGMRLTSIDPEGRIAAAIPGRHVIGCVVRATCSVTEPGLVRHGFGNGLIIGEPRNGEPRNGEPRKGG